MTKIIQGPVEFDNKEGVVLRDTVISGGGLRLRNCPRSVIENVTVRSVRGHGVVLDNCRESVVRRLTSHGNGKVNDKGGRVGHGLLMEGDCHSVLIQGLLAFDNIEDGVQHGNGAIGFVTYVDAILRDNNENAVDIKGGEAAFILSYLSQTRRDSPILMHNTAKRVTLVRSVVRGHDDAPIVTATSGYFHASATDFHKLSDKRWWRAGAAVFDKGWPDHADLSFDRLCRLMPN